MHETPPETRTNEELRKQLADLQTEHERLLGERDQLRRAYLDLLAKARQLELGVLGSGRERDLSHPEQLTIEMLAMMASGESPAPPAPPDKKNVREHERARPTGRKPLPEALPRVDVTVLPPEVEARGTDAFEQIGEDVTETVERRPASLVVVRVHKPKFVEKERDLTQDVRVIQAEPPELPIERGLAGPALLADTIVRRWDEHTPLHRMERIYGRDGLELPRSTVCDWHMSLAQLTRPLIAAMWKDALEAPYLCVDATGVLVQELEKCRRAHFFVVASPERHVLFGFASKHNSEAVDLLLGDYKGYLVADAHAVYDHLYVKGDIVEVGCWAHARRYFFKALGSEPERAREALNWIGLLFHLERLHKTSPPDERKRARQQSSAAVLATFEAWCDEQVDKVIDETPLARAIGYVRNHRAALRRFLDDGRLPIHNNWSERELRREAVGRKNWLFVGSDEGGVVNATFVSLIASCQQHGLNAYEYLRDLLCLLPSWPAAKVLELAPVNWRQTSARDDVRQQLEANIYRRVSLGGT